MNARIQTERETADPADSPEDARESLLANFIVLPREPHESARVWCHRVILHNIVRVHLSPGSNLVESEVRRILNVSRTPVREALMQLAQENFVQILPQKGTYVSLINMNRVLELRFIRRCVDVEVAALACKAMTPKLDAELADFLKIQTRLAKRLDYEAFMDADDAMHALLYRAAGQPGAWDFFSLNNLHHYRSRILGLRVAGTPNRLIDEHRGLVAALASRDPDKARAEAARHLSDKSRTIDSVRERYPGYVASTDS